MFTSLTQIDVWQYLNPKPKNERKRIVKAKNLEELDISSICTGIVPEEKGFRCLACGAFFQEGEVYPVEGHFYLPEKAAQMHTQREHEDRLEALLEANNRYLTLTAHQKKLMRLLYAGLSDAEIAAETGATIATVRRQRFMFREKEKQAKMYLAVYQLVQQKRKKEDDLIFMHTQAEWMYGNFETTQKEEEKILQNAFESMQPLRLKHFPVKEKKRAVIIRLIARQFSKGKDYTEKEVNDILHDIYEDHVTLRRYLVDYHYLQRTNNGSRYWVPDNNTGQS